MDLRFGRWRRCPRGVAGVIAAACTGAGAVLAAAEAGADSQQEAARICELIDIDPSPASIVSAVDMLRMEKVPEQTIKSAVFIAFTIQCPEYTPLMEQAEQTWDMHPCYNGRTGESDPICANAQTSTM